MISLRMLPPVRPTAHVLQGDCANLAQRIHRLSPIQTSETTKSYVESALRRFVFLEWPGGASVLASRRGSNQTLQLELNRCIVLPLPVGVSLTSPDDTPRNVPEQFPLTPEFSRGIGLPQSDTADETDNPAGD
jgi:hypothetical protein